LVDGNTPAVNPSVGAAAATGIKGDEYDPAPRDCAKPGMRLTPLPRWLKARIGLARDVGDRLHHLAQARSL
jgi:hypothetical protein